MTVAPAHQPPVDLLTKYAVRTEIGGRSTGKSTYMIGEVEKNLHGLIRTYVEEYKMRCIIMDPSNDREHPVDYNKVPIVKWREAIRSLRAGKFKRGVIRTIFTDPDEAEEFVWNLCGFDYNDKRKPIEKCNSVKDLLLVVDDAAMFVPQNMKRTSWERFGLETKNKHNSMSYMYHGWKWIPPRLEAITNEYVIFKTTADTPQDRGISNRDVLAAYARVMAHESQFYHETVKNG